MNAQALQRLLQEGLAHHRAGRLDQAAARYRDVTRAAPKLFDAVHLGGLVAYQQGHYAEAVTLLTRAVALNPSSAQAALRLGLALIATGKPVEAEKHLRISLARDAAPTETWHALGMALRAQGRIPEAIEAWRHALGINPNLAETHDQLGAVLADTQGFAAGLPHFRRAVELMPNHAASWCNLGLALAQTGALDEAREALNRALHIEPRFHQARVGRALANQKAHRIAEAAAEYQTVTAFQPRNWEARSARLLCLNYLDTLSAESVFQEHRTFGEIAAQAAAEAARGRPTPTAPRKPGVATPDRRLRVGFLSPDFRNHSVAYFVEPLLRQLPRNRFELFLYHDHAVCDTMTARLQGQADHWRHFAAQPNDRVEAAIRADHLDVLVDLAGHTGYNRLPLYARRLAPTQITYLGYPNTTGLKEMDFRFTDALADPEGAADALHTEKLVRFAPTAWCYQPPLNAPDVVTPALRTRGHVTFGSFNNLSKLSETTFALWAGLLRALPDARLVLKGSGLEHAQAQADWAARWQAFGVSANRITLLPRTTGVAEHLAQYQHIDIALDTFPYHGTTTTCEALWMGRPVLTLAGDRHASRVGLSLLTAVGHPDWAAATPQAYVDQAVALASNVDALETLSAGLRAQLRASPLLDHAAQALRFADALALCAR